MEVAGGQAVPCWNSAVREDGVLPLLVHTPSRLRNGVWKSLSLWTEAKKKPLGQVSTTSEAIRIAVPVQGLRVGIHHAAVTPRKSGGKEVVRSVVKFRMAKGGIDEMGEGNILLDLQFKNAGVVESSMKFEYRHRPCYYAEDVDAWSTPWSNANYRYLYEVRDGELFAPPVGMRSSVPLGGLGAGTVELRADGSLRDWNIFNNSPAGGGGKVQLEDALFALRVQDDGNVIARALRTHPPSGLPPIARIEYSGAFPVSRLRFIDDSLPLQLELFAYCEFRPHDPEGSATPAVIFTFKLRNATNRSLTSSVLFNLPNHIGGVYSSGEGLTLCKTGTSPTSGTMAVRIADRDVPICYFVADDLASLWAQFANGGMGRKTLQGENARYASIAVDLSLSPSQSGTVTFVLAWHFPHRPHSGQVLGNYYANLYVSADDVAEKVVERLPSTWESIWRWHQLCFDNSLPDWLQDALVNSVATMFKTGMWFADGRWRQWESFCCPAVDPIHIHFYRSLPYAFFFPSLQQNLLRGYASAQRDDGYIQENLGYRNSPLDEPSGGRMMGDGCTAFLLEMYQNYIWTGDKEFLNSLWVNAKKAAQWQIVRSQKYGLPDHLNNTYDWWNFEDKELVAYNAILHICAMMAARELALIQGDSKFAEECRKNLEAASKALEEYLWTGKHYRAWWEKGAELRDTLHSDTLYGQLWAFILGLGFTVPHQRIASHLSAELERNASPFGLRVMSGTECDYDSHPYPRAGHAPYEGGPVNNLVWQAGSLDWAALNIYIGGDVEESLREAQKVINNWREHLRDQWNWHDLTTGWNGHPWCNSHYSRQLILWAVPLALSGQQYFAPEKRLRFQPRLKAPCKLPFFTPKAFGTLELLDDRLCRLTVLQGELELNELQVGDVICKKALQLKAGEPIDVTRGQ